MKEKVRKNERKDKKEKKLICEKKKWEKERKG